MIKNWNGSFTLKTCDGEYMRFRVDGAPGIVVIVGATHLIESVAAHCLVDPDPDTMIFRSVGQLNPFDLASPQLYSAIVSYLEQDYLPREFRTVVRSNPYLVDQVGVGRTIALDRVDGEWRYDLLSNHPDWRRVQALTAGEFWSSVGSSWVTKKVHALDKLLDIDHPVNELGEMCDCYHEPLRPEDVQAVESWVHSLRVSSAGWSAWSVL